MKTVLSRQLGPRRFGGVVVVFGVGVAVATAAGTLSPTPGTVDEGTTVMRAPQRSLSQSAVGVLFEPNVGQADPQVQFIARSGGGTLFVLPTGATLVAGGSELRMHLEGGDEAAEPAAADPLSGRVNYLSGSDPAMWKTNIPTYRSIRYREVYPKIDLVYRGNGVAVEYDFHLSPGADPDQIALSFDGVTSARIGSDGDLILTVGGHEVRHRKPIAFQDRLGHRADVAASFELGVDHRVTFAIGDYDPGTPLIIDPLIFSTFLGGTGRDIIRGLDIDSQGSSYVTGQTTSANFPVSGSAVQPSSGGGASDVFIAKLDPTGSSLVYSTYLGGSDAEEAFGIAVDASGNAYVTGRTVSPNFPAVPFPGHTVEPEDQVFVAKLNSSGSTLVYSRYLGGGLTSRGTAIAVDASGAAYVTGVTTSPSFPTAAPLQATLRGPRDAFVSKINALGDSLVYSTFLGGDSGDQGHGIAVDASGNSYVTGLTFSSNFPTVNPFQATHRNLSSEDGFVAKFNSAGSVLEYSSFLGGSNIDIPRSIAIDTGGSAYVTGGTRSTDFPLAGSPLRSSLVGINEDVFVTKIAGSGSALVYSTYLGGSDGETGFTIAVDQVGVAHVGGRTLSPNFPTVSPIQPTKLFAYDGFVAHVNPSGSALLFSTFLGSSGGTEDVQGIAVDGAGADVVGGNAEAADFPTAGDPFQEIFGGLTDGFVARLVPGPAPPPESPPPADFDGDGDTDVSIFRPSSGQWLSLGQPSAFLGLDGDIPVPCEFDGGGDTDRAVFRPSVGGWYVDGISPVFFGLPGDLPVPADYDGDGRCDIAVFRPSVGGWYVRGADPVFFGLNGDIPVPGDYDGDGTADIAVFRPSVGGWYVHGAATTFFGLPGDIPVPGDYDGNGTTDIAIFRPSVGGWYFNGGSTSFLGLSSDIPVPGDYDGDDTTDLAVYRPSTGQWFIENQAPASFGLDGDIPLPLPAAIRLAASP